MNREDTFWKIKLNSSLKVDPHGVENTISLILLKCMDLAMILWWLKTLPRKLNSALVLFKTGRIDILVLADQLLLLSAPTTSNIDFKYSIFNADGSEAGQCGNGTRAIARFILDQKLSLKNENTIATSTNTMKVRILESGFAQVDMDTPQFQPDQIPFTPTMLSQVKKKPPIQKIFFFTPSH